MSPFCLGSGMNRGLIFLLIIRVSLFYSLGEAAFWLDSRWFNIPICFMSFVVRDLGSKCRWHRSAPMVAMRVVDGGNDKARTEPERRLCRVSEKGRGRCGGAVVSSGGGFRL